MGKKIRIRDEDPDHISESLESIFWVKIPKFFYANPDLGSGIFLTLDNPDLISESLETIFWVNILKFFDADPDPGSGIFLPETTRIIFPRV
jgi:hypothetical protein